MMEQGILIDPAQLGIQPLMIQNSWIVEKASACNKPWEQCESKDVRVVTAFGTLNKHLQDMPGEVKKSEAIYSAIATWSHMGEIDFCDMYWQLPFRTNTAKARKKIAYLRVKTSFGVLCYTQAPMGLLGMDTWQSLLTDKLFGDLVLAGKVVTIADNMYFGGGSITELQQTFEDIIARCDKANLRIKPEKIKINVRSAEILGLHWNAGSLTPSPHKLDPLAHCETPKTVKGLHSFLGGVWFNEVCLSGPKLALRHPAPGCTDWERQGRQGHH